MTHLSNAPAARGPRYAVYWVPPPQHPLWRAGCEWLGRDPELPDERAAPAYARSPWHYGFHATLKAPMQLVDGLGERDFLGAVADIAQQQADFAMPGLVVDWLAGFLALRPAGPLDEAHPLRRLANECVTRLDAWRRPADPGELARRQAALHNDADRAMLARWGYPHVLSRWRFHLTLSDSGLASPRQLQARADAHFEHALAQPLWACGVAVFREEGPGQPFRLIQRFALATAPLAERADAVTCAESAFDTTRAVRSV